MLVRNENLQTVEVKDMANQLLETVDFNNYADVSEDEAKEASRLDDYKAMAAKLEGQTLKIGVKAGTSGKIFGSVTSVQIAAALKDQLDLDIERKKIHLPVLFQPAKRVLPDEGTPQLIQTFFHHIGDKILFNIFITMSKNL